LKLEQATVDGEELTVPLQIYFTKVKEPKIEKRLIRLPHIQHDVLRVISLLVGRREMDYDISELKNMKKTVRMWIAELLNSYPKTDPRTVEYLLLEFCEGLMTRAREENKFSILFVMKDLVLLAHSAAGEGIINIEDNIKVLERFLDSDNVIRFARFQKKNESIRINFYEKTASESFIKFLGIPPGDVFYDEREVRIHSEIDGLKCVFQMDWNDAVAKFIDRKDLRIDNDFLITPSGKKYKVEGIWRGRKQFNTAEDFTTHLYAVRYNIDSYREKYNEAIAGLNPYLGMHVDTKEGVKKIDGGREENVLPKSHPEFVIVCCNERVPLHSSFANDIVEKCIRNEAIRIYHAGAQFSAKPIVIGSIEVFNSIGIGENTLKILDTISSELKDCESISLKNVMLCTAFGVVLADCGSPSNSFFKYLYECLAKGQIDLQRPMVQEEKGSIEFKARDWFSGDDTEIAKRVSMELSKMVASQGSAILIIGNDEQSKTWDPIPSSRCKPERVKTLEKLVCKKLKSGECKLVRVPFNDGYLISISVVSKHLSQEEQP
jgi:hypothetical protein